MASFLSTLPRCRFPPQAQRPYPCTLTLFLGMGPTALSCELCISGLLGPCPAPQACGLHGQVHKHNVHLTPTKGLGLSCLMRMLVLDLEPSSPSLLS